jgi:hypothetical protein
MLASRDARDLPNCDQLGDPFASGSWIDANGAVTQVDSVPIRPGRPFVDVRTRIAAARGDRFREVDGSGRELGDATSGCTSLYVTTLREDGRYKYMA